jgi:2-oxo-4-hydroxy-4-carboxy-5-ureidoimidazoline decarboxylase
MARSAPPLRDTVHFDDLSFLADLIDPAASLLARAVKRPGDAPMEEERGQAGLQRLNALAFEEARRQLLTCCGSSIWAGRMAGYRPFSSVKEMHADATDLFSELSGADWKEAFSRHPRIGETKGVSKWSAQEQRGVQGADQQILAELAGLNKVYFEQFGYIYIVCAAGKSAADMLDLLKQRLGHDPQTELTYAAAEQIKITHLRLDKLLL